MQKSEALEFFGNSVTELAKALDMTQSAINQWKSVVPVGRRAAVREAMRARAKKLEAEAKLLRKASKED
jgi:hypothetical protein